MVLNSDKSYKVLHAYFAVFLTGSFCFLVA